MSRCLWCSEHIMLTLSFSDLLFSGSQKETLCAFCQLKLESLLEKERCNGCGREQVNAAYCSDCLNWKKQYPAYQFKHTALYAYNDFAKEYIKKFKIMGDCELAIIFGRDISRWIKSQKEELLVIPIPISKKSQTVRGFNQTELLLNLAGIPFKNVLENKSEQEKQSKKNKKERMQLIQPFIIKKEAAIKGASILIVDDIYTTGRTLFHAAEAVQIHQPKAIQTFSLFR